MALFVKCNVLFHCSCSHLMTLGNATYSVCRMISCINHSPIKDGLVMFAHCMKLQVISEEIPSTENFQDPRSCLRTDSEGVFGLLSFLCALLVPCTSAQLKVEIAVVL